MEIKLCSFNCKGFNISKVKHINDILLSCDILMLQETWLLESQIGTINQYFSDFNTYGISGMNEKVLIQGRKYGGCSFLFKKSLASSITYVSLKLNRVCCIKIRTEFGYIYVFNVYMPCDTLSNEYLDEYNTVLSSISTCLHDHKVDYCLIAGDLNTDLSRHLSGNTISLNSFIAIENLEFILPKFHNNVPFTFTSITQSKSLIDHYIVSQNLLSHVSDYFTKDSIDNLSDHIPLYCMLSCSLDYTLYANVPFSRSSPQWESVTNDQIYNYQVCLNSMLFHFPCLNLFEIVL